MTLFARGPLQALFATYPEHPQQPRHASWKGVEHTDPMTVQLPTPRR